MFTISSQEDIWRCISELSDNNITISDIKISDDFVFHIVISGDDRDGMLDADIAKLVIKIQNLAFNYYSIALNIPLDEVKRKYYKNIRITATIERGSDTFTAFFSSFFQELIGKMTDIQSVFVMLTGIGAFSACYTIKKYLEYLNEKRNAILTANKDNQLIAVLNKMTEIVGSAIPKNVEKEMDNSIILVSKEVLNHMDKEDTVTFSSTGETLTRKEFRKRFPKENTEQQYIYLDGKYGISEVSRTPDGIYKIKITDDNDDYVKGTAALNQNDLRVLINELIPSGAQDLQVNARVDEYGKFTEITIIGLGAARSGSMSIADARHEED